MKERNKCKNFAEFTMHWSLRKLVTRLLEHARDQCVFDTIEHSSTSFKGNIEEREVMKERAKRKKSKEKRLTQLQTHSHDLTCECSRKMT